MTSREPETRIPVTSQGELLAVVPRMLGFEPSRSLVVVGLMQPRGRVGVMFRYDLPPMDLMPTAADHAASILTGHGMRDAVAIGYGTGQEITPRMDVLRHKMTASGVELKDALRVDEGRWWSYLCSDPACHPVEGTPVGAAQHIAPADLDQVGQVRPGGREALAATIAPVTGEQETAMREAYAQAADEAASCALREGGNPVRDAGLAAVRSAIAAYREGDEVDAAEHARIGLALRDIRIRDDAWARLDSAHAEAHTRLWTDNVRRAQPGYVAAPASLLAVSAAQRGNGPLANIALDRALEDEPGYSMAHLVRDALAAGVPPSAMTPPMTPEEVAATYGLAPDAGTGATQIEAG